MTDSTWAESDASNTAPLGHCGPEERWKLEKRGGNNYPVVLIPALLASQEVWRITRRNGLCEEVRVDSAWWKKLLRADELKKKEEKKKPQK